MPDPSDRIPNRALYLMVLTAVLIAAGVALWQWRQSLVPPPVAALSEAGNAALYEHESQDFRTWCSGQSIDPSRVALCKRKAQRLRSIHRLRPGLSG